MPRTLLRRANTNDVGKTLGVDASDYLERDVDVLICSARYDRRWEIVPLHHSQSVTAPAKSHTKVWLSGKADFVGVDSDEQHDVSRATLRTADAEACAVWSGARCSIARR